MMNSALMQPGSEKAKKGNLGSETESKVQFIKIDDGHVLARVTRGATVVEAIISTVPPESSDILETLPTPAVATQGTP
jgi:hypothetical protein